MNEQQRSTGVRVRVAFVWLCLVSVIGVPLLIAATSPLQASRNVAYVIGGLSGVFALGLLLLQPLLAAGYLPGLPVVDSRRWHQWLGICIVAAVILHIVGLYLTSPDDMSDALLLVAPTPYSVYGVIGLWGVVLTALLVALRSRLRLRITTWRILHNALAVIVVLASVVHALMIDGAMGSRSKLILSVLVLIAVATVTLHLRVLKPMSRSR